MSDATVGARRLRWGPILTAGLISVSIAAAATWLIDGVLIDLSLMKTNSFRELLSGLRNTAWAAVIPLFLFLREVFNQAVAAPGSAPAGESPSHRFWIFGITSGLVLAVLCQGFSFLAGAVGGEVVALLADRKISIDEATKVQLIFTFASIILPIAFLGSLAIGWSLHRRKIPRPFLCMLLIGAILLLMRAVDVHFLPDSWRSIDDPGMLLRLGLLPATCLVGVLLAFLARASVTAISSAVSSRLARAA